MGDAAVHTVTYHDSTAGGVVAGILLLFCFVMLVVLIVKVLRG